MPTSDKGINTLMQYGIMSKKKNDKNNENDRLQNILMQFERDMILWQPSYELTGEENAQLTSYKTEMMFFILNKYVVDTFMKKE